MTVLDRATETLEEQRLARLRAALATAPFDALLLNAPANVHYTSGYRSVGAAVHGMAAMAAVVTPEQLLLVGPVADSAPAFDAGLPETDFVAYGRFYFESPGGTARATGLVDEHPDLAAATATAVRRLGLERGRLGVDTDLGGALAGPLASALPGLRLAEAAGWLSQLRAVKLPAEVTLLERSARAAEDGIVRAIAGARPGSTERDLARVVARTMVDAGLEPRFVVVTSGPRTALADAFATDRPIEPGDLVRFDVGGTLEGYWSDIGRTAVVGPAADRQRRLYDALLRGEQAELDLAGPGVPASIVFRRAIEVIEAAGGPVPYRRQHCGHGIGLTAYEPPIIRPGDDGPLRPGMVFCFETPYYELGWGGMMVEDTLVVTEDGCRMLTDRSRGLAEVAV
jgi:Xaa-Pro dipeptidase